MDATTERRTPARLSNPRPADPDRKPAHPAHYHLWPNDHADGWHVSASGPGWTKTTKHPLAAIDRRRIKGMAKHGLCRLHIHS